MQALLGLMLMTPMAANATDGDTDVDMLVLKMTDETTKEFMIADKPIITFENDKLKVTSQSVTTDFDQAAVAEFYFQKYDPATGITAAQGKFFSFTYNDNANIVVAGTTAKKATLYTVDGKLIKAQKIANGTATINLADCQSGVYVLNLENEQSFKIIKK